MLETGKPKYLLQQKIEFAIVKSSVLTFVIAILLVTFAIQSSAAASGPENILLVINASSADSKAVGNHYIELRNIPPSNVVYIPRVTVVKQSDSQSIQSWRFQKEVLGPVWDAIDQRGLRDQIQCIVYSTGFPTRVVFQAELQKYLDATGQKKNRIWNVAWGSTTGITYFRDSALTPQTTMLKPDANWYAVDQVRNLLANPFEGESAKTFETASKQLSDGQYQTAADSFAELVDGNPRQVTARYFLVRALAKAGKSDEAMQQLKLCQQSGWSYREITRKDPALYSLKQHAEYSEVLGTIANLPVGMLPGRSFSSSQWYAKNGWPNGSEQQGRKYIMSTVLAVVRPQGSTRQQAIRQLDRSVAADGTGPSGVFFFAKHKDVRSRVRVRQMDQTAARLKAKGFEVVVSEQKWPRDRIDVIGATLGSAKIDWTNSDANLLPGCIVDNLTSAGGIFPETVQTPLTAHLNKGATGATGTVFEPFAVEAKFPTTRMHEHTVAGFSMAESIYQTVKSPFQLLVVGDPLCSPFGQFPEFELSSAADLKKLDGQFEVQVKLAPDSPPAARFELFSDGLFVGKISKPKSFTIDTSGLSDGYHEMRVVGASATPAANRTSKSLEIVVNRSGRIAKIKARDSKLKINQMLNLDVSCSFSKEVEVWSNDRVLARVASGSVAKIDTRLLGLGKSKLFAVGISDDGDGGAVSSWPVIVEVVE